MQSETAFELALAKDPNYALAYVGMAWVWICRNQMGSVPPVKLCQSQKLPFKMRWNSILT